MQTNSYEIRGIPLFLLREYFEEMGGKAENDNLVIGEGWTVSLTRMEAFQLGSLSVGQTRVEIRAEEHLMDGLLEQIRKKTLRAGA